ncbi:phage portal protein [Candidatus Dojkabacteria bacterium]|jgi:hypothetical protein|nr:phage portal protein [Candidatus Dojkabacteria bacterium]
MSIVQNLSQTLQNYFTRKDEVAKEDTLLSELNAKFTDLDSETAQRLEKYRLYSAFYDGYQWDRIEGFKGHKYVSNLCAPTIQKYASLLMGEFPKMHVPDKDNINEDIAYIKPPKEEAPMFLDEIQKINRAESIGKILKRVLFMDNTKQEFFEGATSGSLLGDTCFFHYYGKDKKIHIENIAPNFVRYKFAGNDYKKIEYAFIVKILSLNEIKKKYDIDAHNDTMDLSIWDENLLLKDGGDYAVVKEYWDDETHAIIINNQFALKPEKHRYPFIPLTYIPNKPRPFRPWGDSDLKDILTIQEEYNIANSDEAKIVKLFSHPKIVGTNITQKDADMIKKASSLGLVLPLRKDATLAPLEFKGNIYPIQQRKNDILQRYYMVSGLVPVFWGAVQGSIVTGVAMTAQASPTLQIIRNKLEIWDIGLKSICKFILALLEKKGGRISGTELTYAELIDGQYEVDFQWENRMPRDDSIYITNELNKMNAGIQARTTAMTRLGVENPNDEMLKISAEKTDPNFSPDFALKAFQVLMQGINQKGTATPPPEAPTMNPQQGAVMANNPGAPAGPMSMPGVQGGGGRPTSEPIA